MLEQILRSATRPEDPPAGVVHEHDDRREPVARRVRDLGARHLEGAVAAEHERPHAGADLRAERGRHAEAHRRVVALREVEPAARQPQVEPAEQHVARLGERRRSRARREEVVHLEQQVVDRERRSRRRGLRARRALQVVVVADALARSAAALAPRARATKSRERRRRCRCGSRRSRARRPPRPSGRARTCGSRRRGSCR